MNLMNGHEDMCIIYIWIVIVTNNMNGLAQFQQIQVPQPQNTVQQLDNQYLVEDSSMVY